MSSLKHGTTIERVDSAARAPLLTMTLRGGAMTDEAIAPPGWGFLPGAKLVPSIEDLPTLPLLGLLRPCDRIPAVTRALIQNPAVLRVCSPLELFKRYGEQFSIDRQRWYEIHANAMLGRVPKSHAHPGRPRDTRRMN